MAAPTDPRMKAAALSEMVYRRGATDQPITVDEIGVAFIADLTISGLARHDKYYYNDTTGFVGTITEDANFVYVTYRGTVMSSIGGSVSGRRQAALCYPHLFLVDER